MGERLIKPYEISVWEDKLTQNGFIENKLAVIGSDTMTGLNKIYNPVFHKKSNGEKTLSFSLKYKYFDPYSGNEGVINPFAALLINERKIKLHYDNQWYEFIIKEHTESSDGLEWTYSCVDAFVLELSKTGYNITFDSELNNNQGTAYELASETIKDTNWQIGRAEAGPQLIAEPIYIATLETTDGITIVNVNNTSETISGKTNIYLFYSYIKNQDGKNVQFIIHDLNRKYTIDNKNVITDTNFRITTELVYKVKVINNQEIKGFWKVQDNSEDILIISWVEPENLYQANRIVYNQLMTYDPIMEHMVNRFKADDLEIYQYNDDIYTTSNIISNYITNGDNFNILEDGSLQGWNPYVETTGTIEKLELVTKPELGTNKELVDLETLSQIEGFLKVKFPGTLTNSYQNAIYNSGFENNASIIHAVSQGDKFLFRWRATKDINSYTPATDLRLIVAKYTQDTPTWGYYYKHIDPNNIILQFNGTPKKLDNIITGGEIINNIYVIDGIPQATSTKYKYRSNNIDYVWNGQTFEPLANDNFLSYYYLEAEAKQAVSNITLTNSTEKIGIFIYHTSGDNTYYIQDIQLTRCVKDENNTPILIGNIPTATIESKSYYYVKPEGSITADEVKTYANVDELKRDLTLPSSTQVLPLYNEDAEKYLSISVSQSNCFNILQTIGETFECWIDLVVEHDENGYIIRDEFGIPQKFIYLREYIGKDNYAGFKYGINLQSIQRSITSDEIVTKLIVDQSQSDLAEEGYISIANALSNQSGESYIYNFDYYCNQGLLDKNKMNLEKNELIFTISEINHQIQLKEKERQNLEQALTVLGSQRNIYTELINTAQNTQTQALDEFANLVKEPYETYKEKHPTLEEAKQLTEEETILNVLGKLYNSSSVINNYSGLLTNINKEYWEVRKKLRGSENYKVRVWTAKDNNQTKHIYIELNDYLNNFSFQLNISQETYICTTSKKFFDIEVYNNNPIIITFNPPAGYTMTTTVYTVIDKESKFNIVSDQTFEGVEDEINDLVSNKKELIKQFENKYSRFIQEGTWSSTDYIDSELYYFDAVQVSNTSAQPIVSYTVNVVEISALEGFEWYKFDTGDKTYVEDTEFFGWSNQNGVLTPAREEVIVSEVEWHLEEPENNVITVQNYRTRFEDLFQRINATVQTVQYNEATYAKISSLLDANGVINQNVLLDSLNRISGQKYNLTSDGSISIDGDQITIRNLTNAANLVIINSEGISVSADGGNNWKKVIDGFGINADAVITGSLNTNSVIIGDSQNPSFRWDKSGISAYGSVITINDQNQEVETYDLQKYVRYDQYGLYGIKDGEFFKAQSINDVLRKAHFAVTWDGFFIRNNYTDGRVEITSDNDFRVIQSLVDNDNEKRDHERIKIGALEFDQSGNPIKYGININQTVYNSETGQYEDIPAFTTGSDGNITITGTINANAGVFDGLVQVGTGNPYIAIDGEQAEIRSSNYAPGGGTGWMIDKEGDAYFMNITARGSIRTAVFEYAEIQAVGGIFLFRPSSAIKGARVDGSNLILKVEKPLLFAKISYSKIDNPSDNPQIQGWYEKTNYGYQLTEDTEIVAEKDYFIKDEITNGSWCKVSNYISDNVPADSTIQNIRLTNGLSHVYKVIYVNTATKEVTLQNAASMVTGADAVTTLEELEGGALIDMGREDGTTNYGIGVNSSDNTVNLPRRAISLFETEIKPNAQNDIRVTYNYRGILGTLPELPTTQVEDSIYNRYMAGTQGIYTDNMYLGDDEQFLTFYTDTSDPQNPKKKLRIRANQVVFEVYDKETRESTGQYQDINDFDPKGTPGPAGQDAISVVIESNVGNEFIMTNETATLTCTVYQGTENITSTVTNFLWTKNQANGTPDVTWNTAHENYNLPYVEVTPSEINKKAIFGCRVTLPE